MRKTIDRDRLDALGRALAAVAPHLDDPTTLANRLIEALLQTTDRQQRAALGRALAAVAPSLDDPTTLAENIIEALRQTNDPDCLDARQCVGGRCRAAR
jgi:hypothetical protein